MFYLPILGLILASHIQSNFSDRHFRQHARDVRTNNVKEKSQPMGLAKI
jgi:hypothetical protein